MPTTRQAVQALVDALPEARLEAARAVLEAIFRGVAGDDLEDALDAYLVQVRRDESTADDYEPLEALGRRLGITD